MPTTASRSTRRRLGAVLALLLTAAAVLVPAQAASAVTAVTCTGTNTTSYSPGLTNTTGPQTVTSETRYTSCLHVVDLATTTMTGGFGPRTFTREQSCNDVLAPASGIQLIQWDNGSTSSFTYSRTATSVSGNLVITLTGAITSGLYTGALATKTIVFNGLAGLAVCDTPPGLTSLNGTATLVITGP